MMYCRIVEKLNYQSKTSKLITIPFHAENDKTRFEDFKDLLLCLACSVSTAAKST